MKNLISTFVVAVALATGLAACSDPKNTPLPNDVAKMDSLKPVFEKLQPEDKELLAGYVMRRTFAGALPGTAKNVGVMTATTVGQAIDQQRTFLAESRARDAAEKAANEQIKLEREVAIKTLRELVSVGLVSKEIETQRGASGMELDRVLAVAFSFKNNSSKDISGVKGRIIARDLFGDDISAFQISNDTTIKVGGGTIWTGTRSVRFAFGSNKDGKFSELAEDKFTLVWEPQVIVFTDGTKAAAP